MLEHLILDWYDANRRHMPWRSEPGIVPNAYHVLLSEIMLQQTTVATVKDYFLRFIDRWPTLQELTAASLEDVYHSWQGLGYYSRAKNLHNCSIQVMERFGGNIPTSIEELSTLPGIGPYTAAAVGSIAYEQPTVPVDGNIIRVFSRIFAVHTPLPALKDEIFELVKDHVPTIRRGDFAQALMDIGATICKPRSPTCGVCPLQQICQAYSRGLMEVLPASQEKPLKPKRYGFVFWYESKDGSVHIRRRPPKGLLANLMEIPGTDWVDKPINLVDACQLSPSDSVKWTLLPERVQHTFTHFHLELQILKSVGDNLEGVNGLQICHKEDFHNHAFPTLMKKVIGICMGGKK